MTRTTTKLRPRGTDCAPGLIPASEMFERALPGPLMPDGDLPFEERIERAWRRLKAGFREDEHERLPKALAATLALEFQKEETT